MSLISGARLLVDMEFRQKLVHHRAADAVLFGKLSATELKVRCDGVTESWDQDATVHCFASC